MKQTIYITHTGLIDKSHGSLLNPNDLKDTSLLIEFPLIESIFKELWDSKKPILFEGLKKPHTMLTGIYDFIFERDDDVIKWTILEKTENYSELISKQQKTHEKIINQQKKD